MSMTHYMELLMLNSPWNLLIFMALPVVLAETMAITELVILYQGEAAGKTVLGLNRLCGILAGLVFIGIALWLVPNVVIPVTQENGWRTWIDTLAVFSYLAGAIPMIVLALSETRLIMRQAAERTRRGAHVVLLSAFLILSHIAMISGMADPAVAGWEAPEAAMHEMHHGHDHSMHSEHAGHMDHSMHSEHGHSMH